MTEFPFWLANNGMETERSTVFRQLGLVSFGLLGNDPDWLGYQGFNFSGLRFGSLELNYVSDFEWRRNILLIIC